MLNLMTSILAWFGDYKDALVVIISFLGVFVGLLQQRNLANQQRKTLAMARIQRITEEIGKALSISRAWELELSAEHTPYSMEAITYQSILTVSAMLDPQINEEQNLLEALKKFSGARGEKVKTARNDVLDKTQVVIRRIRTQAKLVGEY